MFGTPKRNVVEIVFGYTDLEGISCPICGSNYIAMEIHNGQDKLLCWCGASCNINFDSADERLQFVDRYIRRLNDDD